jgi:uncharacterized protein DUF3800
MPNPIGTVTATNRRLSFPVHLVFADDSKQDHPTRAGTVPLVAAGAILVPSDRARTTGNASPKTLPENGFPVDDPLRSEFKWSPGREHWISRNLIWPEREAFFLSVIEFLAQAGVKAIVAIDDLDCPVANDQANGTEPLTHEQDATYLLFERINSFLKELDEDALVINDRPSRGSTIEHENKFLASSLEMWRSGTRFVRFNRIAINLLCTQSRFVRLLQCADLITSCVTQHVAGENIWSPPIFQAIKPLIHAKNKRTGGHGLKFHSTRHRNLYHWLLGDSTYHAGGTLYPLPFLKALRPPRDAANGGVANILAIARYR